MGMQVARPDHVASELAVDFDFYAPCPRGEDPFEAWAKLQGGPPVVWTPHNGGHWIATTGAVTKEVLTDVERFSSRFAFIPKADRPPAVPLELDPPVHAPFRRMLLPVMSPQSVRKWAEEARALAVELIEGFAARGRCEFMADFAQQLPIIIILRMLNLPMADRLPLLEAVNSNLRPTSEDRKVAGRQYMNDYIRNLIAERRAHPGEDIFSGALVADVGGRVMTDDEAAGLASGLIGGGLDTVTATMGWQALCLARNPDLRAQLVSNPDLIPRAIEEMMRRYPVPNIARVVREDMEYEGAQMKAGEQILVSACMHSMDPAVFADPLTVDFTRKDAWKHSSFSHGNHRCIGAPLAMQELRIFHEEWLKRIPDFRLDPDAPPVLATGIVHAVESLPLVWTVA